MMKAAMLAATLVVSPYLAFADDSGAVTGGAVAGAVVGGPVGAVVGGAASGPNRTVVVEPASPCATRTAQTTDNTGYSRTTQTTNCP